MSSHKDAPALREQFLPGTGAATVRHGDHQPIQAQQQRYRESTQHVSYGVPVGRGSAPMVETTDGSMLPDNLSAQAFHPTLFLTHPDGRVVYIPPASAYHHQAINPEDAETYRRYLEYTYYTHIQQVARMGHIPYNPYGYVNTSPYAYHYMPAYPYVPPHLYIPHLHPYPAAFAGDMSTGNIYPNPRRNQPDLGP